MFYFFLLLFFSGVTAYITVEAIIVIADPTADEEDVNPVFLYSFAASNLLIDILSTIAFYYKGGKNVFISQEKISNDISCSTSSSSHSEEENFDMPTSVPQRLLLTPRILNLNMLSAFIHLTG